MKWKPWLEAIGEKLLDEFDGFVHILKCWGIIFLVYVYRTKDIVVATVYAAINFVWHLFSNLTGRVPFQVDLLKLSITILFYSLYPVENLIAKHEVEDIILSDTFQQCQLALQKWVANVNVIGGSLFGGRIFNEQVLYGYEEFMVNILSNIFYKVLTSCFSCGRKCCLLNHQLVRCYLQAGQNVSGR